MILNPDGVFHRAGRDLNGLYNERHSEQRHDQRHYGGFEILARHALLKRRVLVSRTRYGPDLRRDNRRTCGDRAGPFVWVVGHFGQHILGQEFLLNSDSFCSSADIDTAEFDPVELSSTNVTAEASASRTSDPLSEEGLSGSSPSSASGSASHSSSVR